MLNLLKLEWRKSSSFRITAFVLALILTLFSKILDSTIKNFEDGVFFAITMMIGLLAALFTLLFIGTIFFVKDDLDDSNPMVMILPFTGFQVVMAKMFILIVNIGLVIFLFAIFNTDSLTTILEGYISTTSIRDSYLIESILSMIVNMIVLLYSLSAGFFIITAVKAKTGRANLFIWIVLFALLLLLSIGALILLNLNPILFIPKYMTFYNANIPAEIVSSDSILVTLREIAPGSPNPVWITSISVIPTIIASIASFVFMWFTGKLLDKKVNF